VRLIDRLDRHRWGQVWPSAGLFGGASPLMLRDAVARFRGRALGVADSYAFSRLPLRPELARIGP